MVITWLYGQDLRSFEVFNNSSEYREASKNQHLKFQNRCVHIIQKIRLVCDEIEIKIIRSSKDFDNLVLNINRHRYIVTVFPNAEPTLSVPS
ncbi:hypothetical protein M0813_22726 [Anaeramoeba flamelloides]|uniref:Uncharacterized protein n=1 Tax=Anaeramoeba flamelloides TaxID=1746091 RepID=A0ABQ8YCF5_9EUKA|nr:hypothetical protein M0813_22726 [Anaeramoeba flamelloides]